MIDAVLEFEFITEPKNLELPLKLPEIMENIKRHIFQDFWEEVKTRLQDRLAQSGYDGRWCIKMSAPIDGCRSALEIKDTNDPLTDDRPGWFAMAVECLTGGPEWGYYGIHRGREVTQVADAEDGLIDALKNDGFLQESGWPGFRYIDSVPGMPVIAMTNKETLLRLNEDNRNAGHPLADRMAQLLWELFERHRERLEALNDNYPYAD